MEMMYQPKHLQRWQELINYKGENFDDYYIVHWRFFRCTPTERANHQYIQHRLREVGGDGIEFAVFTDAIMLLRYYVLVHKDNERALKTAENLLERMHRDGCLDEKLREKMHQESMQRQWNQATLKKRVGFCQEAGISVFAARRKVIPTDPKILHILGEE